MKIYSSKYKGSVILYFIFCVEAESAGHKWGRVLFYLCIIELLYGRLALIYPENFQSILKYATFKFKLVFNQFKYSAI